MFDFSLIVDAPLEFHWSISYFVHRHKNKSFQLFVMSFTIFLLYLIFSLWVLVYYALARRTITDICSTKGVLS